MEFIRTKIDFNLLNTCICDCDRTRQDDENVSFVNLLSDLSEDESEEESVLQS